jgi:phosphate transport system protein
MQIAEEIEELDKIIIKMVQQVEENLRYAINTYFHFDCSREYTPINDDIVNQYERMVEEKVLNIMLKERLYAKDMRMVSGIMTMVEDIERLGDHAEDILSFAIKLENCEEFKKYEISELAKFSMKMVKDSFTSYINRDVKLAKDVISRDDYVDEKYSDLIECLIIADNDKLISSSFAVYTTLIVKYIERVADHATNIAEWSIYIATGFYKDAQIV